MNNESTTICMPVLNEIEVIESVLDEWIQVVSQLPEGSQLLIEDGGSKDGTRQCLEEYQRKHENLQVIYKERPEGFGKAALNLLSNANTNWVFFTDSDGQYVATDFWKIWERRSNLDLVRGIKLGRKDPLLRKFTSYIWNGLVKIMFDIPIADINVAFFLVRKDELKKVVTKCKFLDLLVVSELMIRLVTNNCRFGNDIYILHRERHNGKSRAIPIKRLIPVGISHAIGLHNIKKDFRVNY